MFGFGKKNTPAPPTKLPSYHPDRKEEDYVPPKFRTPTEPMTLTARLASQYAINEFVIKEIISEAMAAMPKPSQPSSLTTNDYIELYRLSSMFREQIWNFIQQHAKNKQIGKLQNALSDLDKMDAITQKLSTLVPEEVKKEIQDARE